MQHRDSSKVDPIERASYAANEAHAWMIDAINSIDATPGFGHGYARTHPDLVAAFMLAAALVYSAEKVARATEITGIALGNGGCNG